MFDGCVSLVDAIGLGAFCVVIAGMIGFALGYRGGHVDGYQNGWAESEVQHAPVDQSFDRLNNRIGRLLDDEDEYLRERRERHERFDLAHGHPWHPEAEAGL